MAVTSQSESGLFLRSYLIVSLKFIDVFKTIVERDGVELRTMQVLQTAPFWVTQPWTLLLLHPS